MRQVMLPAAMLAIMFSVLSAGVAASQDAPADLPAAPDPSDCGVTSTVEELLARVGASPVPATPDTTPAATPETAAATADGAPFELPEGQTADPATVAAVTATMWEAVACTNAGDFLAGFALLSDRFAREILGEEPLTEDDVQQLAASPEALPEERRATLHAVRDVRVLPDGRVGALVESEYPDEPPAGVEVDYFYFAEEGGRYLIDGVVENLEGEFPPTSEPAAA
jgi:hypothetical protein